MTLLKSAEIKLNKTNQVEEVFQKIRDKRAKMEKELEFWSAQHSDSMRAPPMDLSWVQMWGSEKANWLVGS